MDYSKCDNKSDGANHESGLLLVPDVDKLFGIKEITFDTNSAEIVFIENKTKDYERWMFIKKSNLSLTV